jgi:hypothetical protein
MSVPHRLRPVSCFENDRLRLQPQSEVVTAKLLIDLPWFPLHLGQEHDYGGRIVRVFTQQLGYRNWYALVWDLRFNEVRLLLVRDRIPDPQLFLRELNPSIEHSAEATIRMVCREA